MNRYMSKYMYMCLWERERIWEFNLRVYTELCIIMLDFFKRYDNVFHLYNLRYSGSIPSGTELITSGEFLTISFTSDGSVTYKGFHLQIEAVQPPNICKFVYFFYFISLKWKVEYVCFYPSMICCLPSEYLFRVQLF